MRRDGLKKGVVTLCIGGGQGIALALEMGRGRGAASGAARVRCRSTARRAGRGLPLLGDRLPALRARDRLPQAAGGGAAAPAGALPRGDRATPRTARRSQRSSRRSRSRIPRCRCTLVGDAAMVGYASDETSGAELRRMIAHCLASGCPDTVGAHAAGRRAGAGPGRRASSPLARRGSFRARFTFRSSARSPSRTCRCRS